MKGTVDRRELAFKAVAGLVGGAIGWLPVELVSNGHSLTERQSRGLVVAGFVAMALLAGIIGGMIRAAEDNSLAITPAAKRRFLIGFAVCLLLSIPETYYSDVIFTGFLNAGGWGVNHAGSEAYLIAGRLAGWTLMGLMLGIGVGLAGASIRNALRGGLGGLIGGFVGGAAFDVIGALTRTGLVSRLTGFCIIGLAIGFFIGLVHQLTKSAWLVVEAGRLKGRQFRLEGARVTVGRAEENSVGLFGDPGVQARHAVIVRERENYALRNLAVQAGTLVNGNRIETVALHEGDHLTIGGYELTFHERAERTKQAAPVVPLRIASAASALSASSGDRGAAAHEATPTNAPGRPVAGAAYLLGRNGQQFAIGRGAPTRLGRAADNDIVISDAAVSRHHARIEARNGAFVLRDLGSQNGTWLGERRVTESQLAHGDSLRLGDAVFTFHD